MYFVFFFKQKTAYEMRISDWSSDVCSSDLDGMRIRSSGNGEPGVNGGPPGDLYVEIHLKPHGIFQRDGEDLHCELTIPFTTAALGGELEEIGRASCRERVCQYV